MKVLSTAAKAIYATLAAGLGSLVTLLVGGNETLSNVSQGQWASVLLVALIAGGGVYNITNKSVVPPA